MNELSLLLYSNQSYRNEASEGQESQHFITLKKRGQKVISSSDSKTKDELSYHGRKTKYHYYQCRQLIFRQQVKKIIAIWKLPVQFEVSPHF